MINHYRSYLLNRTRAVLADPADEYVPAEFSPVRLTPALAALRAKLFGAGEDRHGANVILARIFTAVDVNPSLYKLARDRDRRTTYGAPWPGPPGWSVDGPTQVPVLLPPYPFAEPGRGSGVWVVETSGYGGVTVDGAAADTTPFSIDNPPVEFLDYFQEGLDGFLTGGFPPSQASLVVRLPGSSASVVVPVSPAQSWVVRVWANPTHDWASGAAAIGRSAFEGPGLDDLYKVWLAGPAGYDRSAAVALALARRIADTRVSERG